LKIWLQNANLAKAVAPLATHFHPPHHSLTQREREIAVCIITGKWHAPFSIDAHTQIAWIPRSLYDRAVETLGHGSITDVLVLMGFYTAVSFSLAFYDVPAGAPGMKR
jgi:4-carboxymuconolactone decarboxylase